MKSPYLEAISGLDEVQNTTSPCDIGLESEDNLKPGNIGIRTLYRWRGFDDFVIVGSGAREKVRSRLLNVLRGVE